MKNGILSRLREILGDLIKFPEGRHFAQPIDPERQNLPTYRTIIESPMDFGTVMRNIEANTYKDDIDQAFFDIFLTIDNCFHFNPPENLVSQHCRKMQTRLIKQLRMQPRIPIVLIDLLDRTKPTRWWKDGLMKSQQEDSVERIASFIDMLTKQTPKIRDDDKNSMNLLSQCLQYTATFLIAHPDIIDSFLRTMDLSSSSSNTPFRHDRHLNLISALSQSYSPLFTKLSEPLIDPTFSLRDLLSPHSFTDPASSFFRLASTKPAFFRHLIETHAVFILNIALSTAVSTVRVVSDEPSEPHCLDFGRVTQSWVILLRTMAEVKMDPAQLSEDFNTLPSSLVTFLVLSAASTNDDLSTAAVSVFSTQFCLSTPHTEALLFATPPTFPLSDVLTPRHPQKLGEEHPKGPPQSICAEAGCCVVLYSRSDLSEHKILNFTRKLGIRFAGCLVNALHSTTTLPHSIPFFSPELCGLSHQLSVWNDSSRPSPLTALTTLADIEVKLAFSVSPLDRNLSQADEERRDTVCVHLFPFLGVESQTQFMSSFNTFYRSRDNNIHSSMDRVVECLVEMATVNSSNTPITLLKETRTLTEFHSHIDPATRSVEFHDLFESSFERSIIENLRTAEGEERWRLVTQLAVVSMSEHNIAKELMTAENDAQALLVLSVPTIRSTTHLNLHLDKNPAAFSRVVEFAGRLDNLPLAAAALAHVGDTVESCIYRPRDEALLTNRKQALGDLVFNTLRAIAPPRREGVEEGCVVGKNEVTSQIVKSCLKVLRFLMKFESFDPTPVTNSLVSLAVTTDLSLLRSILVVLQQIEERTRNTPTPFSISAATAPFRGIHQTSVTQQPLPSIVASILLSASQPARAIVHALCEEGMEDRSDLAQDLFSFIFQKMWKGANPKRPDDQTIHNIFVAQGPHPYQRRRRV
ncbi:hypothetical protein BLNAU_10688 [Blattamonas nauphoetae]|uniref:Bromo domain-containing protein n=1 Tax=Blattamonas nauphoetae TaxID=2049346 RepID=A0ABQ9XSZ2_9EUKA|nr:hypothetical protein BLNAU_10688 [Blattamonas nauphoetae]